MELPALYASPSALCPSISPASSTPPETSLGEAVDPARKTCYGALGRRRGVFGGRREHVYVAEPVVGRVERIGAVEKRFELPAHPVVVDRRREGYRIRFAHAFRYGGCIVGYRAALRAQTGKAPLAEADILLFERDLFDSVARIGRASCECVGQCLRVAVCPEAR